jgi:ABC-type branched-subunit amino acid transport system ATPase component
MPWAWSGFPGPAEKIRAIAAAMECRMTLLAVQGVSLRFGGIVALDDVSMTVAAGEIHGLIGPNGAGKSTLVNVISRLYAPSRGTVWLNGVELTRLPAHAVAHQGVARTFQNLELCEAMTVLENVLVGEHTRQRAGFWGSALCTPWAMRSECQARARAMEMLREVRLDALWHRPARLLSFGQRKLLELARALVSRPKLLLLDEPASGLSPPVLRHFVDVVLRSCEAYGMAIVLIEHVIKLVHEVCARVTVLEQGKVIAVDTPAEIQRHPQVLQAYLGQQPAERPRYARPQTANRIPVGSTTSQDAPARVTAATPVVLDVAGVDSYYGPLQVLRQVSLRVHAGEVVALLGGNGSGKSTLLRAVSGLVRPRRGTVLFAGKRIQGWRPERIVRLGLIHVPQGREIFPQLTVAENLRLGAYRCQDAAAVAAELERVYTYFPILRQRAKQYAGFLSGGEQQMLAIGRGLMARPVLLLLDEPSASLAPRVIDEIFAKLADLNAAGIALLIVEQHVSAALAIADYAYVLREGALVAQGTSDALQQGERLQRAYLGRAQGNGSS